MQCEEQIHTQPDPQNNGVQRPTCRKGVRLAVRLPDAEA